MHHGDDCRQPLTVGFCFLEDLEKVGAILAAGGATPGQRRHTFRQSLGTDTFEQAYLQAKVHQVVQTLMPERCKTFNISRTGSALDQQIDEA